MLLDYEQKISQQINEIFTKWALKPSIIIYMVCPKQDVVSLIMRERVDTATADIVEDTLDYRSDSFNSHQDTKKQLFENNDQRNNDSGRVSNMRQKIELQCDFYMRLALPVIERWILTHDPQRVIRVDGRSSTERILQTVNARLYMLPLQPPILPEYMNSEEKYFSYEKNLKQRNKRIFDSLQKRGIVSDKFPWNLSAWEFLCPVNTRCLNEREIYPVRLSRYIFFLSSTKALDMFLKSPKTFVSIEKMSNLPVYVDYSTYPEYINFREYRNFPEYLGHVIDLKTAERLLDCGYYFLSSFGRRCPVQAYTNEILTICSPTFSVIHHSYIYFLNGEKALSAFLMEPSKYISQYFRLPALPLQIAIIGPPKCGKTTLADRFAKTYGLKRITRDVALRHLLKHYGWTESARMVENQLQASQSASLESIIHAIEILSLSPSAISRGYVLDDCPSSREEAERLILSGVQPMIVLDLKADLSYLLPKYQIVDDNTQQELMNYENWQTHQASFRDWLKRFSRNVVELDATSKWSVWTFADSAVRSRFAEIALYHREADLDKVHSLRHMCVSPFEFRARQSQYESYCPVCLFREDVLQASRQLTDNQGMVQFKEHFYWICPQHMAIFVEDPQQYLPPVNTAILPDERPRVLEQVVDVGHACWERRLRLGGWCPVTYVDGPADRKLMRGRTDLAVLLGEEEVYLFCTAECRNKFLAMHSKYRNVEITSTDDIDLQSLSNMDFLEHTVAKEVIKAVKQVAARRPKIVGLSPAASAAIHIGVHLKTHNASGDSNETVIYEVADERMAGQDKIIRIVTDTVKTKPNPYTDEEKQES